MALILQPPVTDDRGRNPRFRRGSAPPIHLTDDDVQIIGHVAHHRFLSSRHIAMLLPLRSEKKLVERLGLLYHAGYLDRPRAQLTYYATAGSSPMVYALGNRGAEVLAHIHEMRRTRLDWTWKNRSAGREFIAHTLATADITVRLSLQALNRGVAFIALPDISAGSKTLKFSVDLPEASKPVSVIPDAAFGLGNKYFFLEADRATMPVTRSDLDQTSIRRKILAYLAGGGRDNRFGNELGIDNFRVLIVTTSVDRVASMLALLRALTDGKGSRQFLFAVHDEFCAAIDPLTFMWISGRGDRTRLLE